jgi:hypothetical protein
MRTRWAPARHPRHRPQADPACLPGKIERLLAHHNVLRRGFGAAEADAERPAERPE